MPFSGVIKKSIWFVICLGCFAAVSYNIVLVFLGYFSYDVNVDVKIVPNVQLPFPAVTICNLTPISGKALKEASGLGTLQDMLGVGTARRRKKRRRKRAGNTNHLLKIIIKSQLAINIIYNTKFSGNRIDGC